MGQAFIWKDKIGNTRNKKEIYKVVVIKMFNNGLAVLSCNPYHPMSCYLVDNDDSKIFTSIRTHDSL